MSSRISALLNIMERALQEASRIVVRDFRELVQLQASIRPNDNFVTLSSRRVAGALERTLGKTHSFPFCTNLQEALKQEECWFALPLDGLENFKSAWPFFAIALVFMKRGKSEALALYHPLVDQLFLAQKGRGVFLNGYRVRASQCRDFSQATGSFSLNVLEENSSQSSLLRDRMRAVHERGARTLVTHTPLLNCAYLAMGTFDFAWQKTQDDLARVGDLLIEESGALLHRNVVHGSSGSSYSQDSFETVMFVPGLRLEMMKAMNLAHEEKA